MNIKILSKLLIVGLCSWYFLFVGLGQDSTLNVGPFLNEEYCELERENLKIKNMHKYISDSCWYDYQS